MAKAPKPADKPAASQTQRATQQLRDMILTNRLPAGSNHLETELAEMLGMSRTPVREATLVLESQGLLKVRPRRGVQILTLSPEDMTEIYQILTELESLAAELVAAKKLSAAKLAPLDRALERMEKSLDDNDREAWAAADEEFHATLVNLSGNSRLAAIVSTYNDQVRRARNLTLFIRPLPRASNEDHARLMEALRDGDAERARELHRQHRMRAKTTLIALLEKHGFHQV
ncbi:GntR family transcriptional regulator [Oceanomicrobium pacificus]|uniref:FCD domain-containing protein n=1 Tax=Oceanomicrobium pacificus TaxID=2692916 RepID=A0A6B0U066_9RHOB|nr:GntR family transcriptional regulator [Oceanomicrobium pacificus]MXU66624.1 FCD domain-containing protein [Oceanomicrobium pacificus]